jgi:hypothetical protein
MVQKMGAKAFEIPEPFVLGLEAVTGGSIVTKKLRLAGGPLGSSI